jgi:hypothetical protein
MLLGHDEGTRIDLARAMDVLLYGMAKSFVLCSLHLIQENRVPIYLNGE